MGFFLEAFSWALSGGVAVSPLDFSPIVNVEVAVEGAQWTCTATKISPTRYLTAAHCVCDPLDGKIFNIKRLTFSHGAVDPVDFNQIVSIKEVFVNPEWKDHIYRLPLLKPEDRLMTGSDQAVIEINELNDLATFPLDFDEIKQGEIVWAAGYGVQALSPGNFLPPGELRMTKKLISGTLLHPKVMPLPAQDLNAENRFSSFAPGDSGGPVLRYTPSRRIPYAPSYSIVGVLSYIDGLFYVDPDSGQITYAENLSDLPSGYFVRNAPANFSPWSFQFFSAKPFVWLQNFAGFTFKIAR